MTALENIANSIEQIDSRHMESIEAEISDLRDRGLDFELQYLAAFNALSLFRRMRGKLLAETDYLHFNNAGALTKLKHEFLTFYNKSKHKEELTRTTKLASRVALAAGELFWTENLSKSDAMYKEFETEINNAMNNYLVEGHCRYGNVQVMLSWKDFTESLRKNGVSGSNNLGEHFIWRLDDDISHLYLNNLEIDKLKNVSDKGGKIILASAASSGLVESGIVAGYMNKYLGIRTEIDPVFFGVFTPTVLINDTIPNCEYLVIPFEDGVHGSGWSPTMVMKAVTSKYDSERIYANELMQSHN